MTFLPEDDRIYLAEKGFEYEELTETLPTGDERRAVKFPRFKLDGHLRALHEGQLVPREVCDVLILIPKGYATTKLDCFYTSPHLKRADGTNPVATAAGEVFKTQWQFWSRHLEDKDWRVGVDGLSTFLSYVDHALRAA
jgi:Prokaryotic E2 family E